jgi:hypothetical protein
MTNYTQSEEAIYDEVISRINNIPKKYIDVSMVASILNIKHHTLIAKIVGGKIKARLGKKKRCKPCYHISKDTLLNLAAINKPAIVGWKLRTDLNRDFQLKNTTISWIVSNNKFCYGKDLFGRVRFPQETVIKITERLPEFLSHDTFVKNGRLYHSVVSLSDAAARNLHDRYDTKAFSKDKKRIYKCLYRWISENKIEHLKTHGVVRLYVPDYVYNEFVKMIRISDAAKLMGCSRRTIYNWLDKRIIEKSVFVGNYPMISINELKGVLVRKVQLMFGMNNLDKLDEISCLDSGFWKKRVSGLKRMKSIFNQNKKNLPEKSYYEYIFNRKGWNKTTVDGIEAVAKLRTPSAWFNWANISLDEKVFDNKEESKSTYFEIENESTLSQKENLLFDDLNYYMEILPEPQKMLVRGYFGVGCDKLSMENLAARTNLSINEVESELQGVLLELRSKLS